MINRLRKKIRLTAFACLLSVISAARADITTGLVAYWKFDETTGIVAEDSSGNGNNATLYNFEFDDSMWVPGRIGGALQFNPVDTGDDDQVVTDLPIFLNNQDSFTFAFWARRQPGDNPFNPRFITPVDGDHWVLWTPGTGVGFYTPAPTADPPIGAWRHYVVLFDRAAGLYSVYVDGEKVVNQVSRPKAEPGDVQWVIGHKELLNDHRDPWRGSLDDLRMYNRILSDDDVKELYAQVAATGPSIVTQPVGGSKFIGDTYTFSVVVEGTAPITYQWLKGGEPISGATNSTLVLADLKVSDSGEYSVGITNAVSGVVSENTTLTVTDPPVDIESSLVLHYEFDETTGLGVNDSSGNGYVGTIWNSFGDDSEWTEGRIGGGLRLNLQDGGNDDYVITDFPIALTNQDLFTFTFWAKAAPGSGVNPRIVTPTTAHWVLWTPGTGLGFYVPASSPEPVVDVWRHFAVVYDRPAGTYQLYVNGTRTGPEITGRFRAAPGEVQWVIGHSESLGAVSDAFAGVLDDLRIYNRRLTAKDVAAIYNLAPPEAPTIVQGPKPIIAGSGDNITLSVVAGGSDLTYQWKKGTEVIASATSERLVLTNATAAQSGEYSVLVKNELGETNTAPVTVTIIPVLNLKNAPATSDADYNTDLTAPKAFDGLRLSTGPNTSRWASPGDNGPHWLMVDLGEPLTLRYVLLDWEGAYGIDYTLSGAPEAEGPWTEIANISGYAQAGHGVDGADVIFDFVTDNIILQSNTSEFPIATIATTDEPVRFLRLDGFNSALGLFSVWEMQVSAEGSTSTPPELSVTRTEEGITISWPSTATGFTLESADALPATTWDTVTGVVDNSITVQPTGQKFYRLSR